MKKIVLISAILAASNSAIGGEATGHEVIITDNSAQGVLSTVRHSADNIQFIGCSLYNDQFGNWALCVAEDTTENTVWCETSDPAKLQMIAAMNPESRFSFKWDENNACSDISVGLNSAFIR